MNNQNISTLNYLKAEIKIKLNQLIDLRNKNEDTQLVMEELKNLSKRKFVLEAKKNEKLTKYGGIIYTIGFSPEPIILSILATNPKYVFFIHTEQSEKYIEQIVEETNLSPLQYKRELMVKDSIADSYRLVKRGLKYLTEVKKLKKNEIAIDATGGTKGMSIGFGIAATIFNLDILYVSNTNYNPLLRRPEPGSENLIYIPNPIEIYQDDKLIEGLNFLRSLNFTYANKVFNNVKELSTKPLFPELLANIAQLLYLWDMVDYKKAYTFLRNFKNRIHILTSDISQIREDIVKILGSWEDYLETIYDQIEKGEKDNNEPEKLSSLLIYDTFINAERDFYKKNYNSAGMKYYRIIEMINQFVLLNKYNINTQNPQYNNLPIDTKELLKNLDQSNQDNVELIILNQYNEIWKFIYNNLLHEKEFKERNLLPRKIGCLAGTIIRVILGDITDKSLISRVYYAAEKRNNCSMAHGIATINKKDCEKFKEIAEEMIKAVEIMENYKNIVFTQQSINKLVNLFIKVI
ncbi:MAG: TIGR02710 family CRISPR-associated CARF protein [Promethearchaeota archaeon]